MPGFRQPPGGSPCTDAALVDSTTGAQVLSTAPGTDTGQRALAVRVVSQLGAGGAGGGLTDAQLRASAVPVADGGGSLTVDGTVTANVGTGPWPVTDNAGSLTVDGTFWQSTQPVSGTFWQSTQPVSLAAAVPVTDNAGSLTVDGTFWQSTQPVSATQLPSALAAGGGLKVEGVAGGVAQPVSGTFWQATQPVSDAGGSLTVDSAQLPSALAANGGIKVEGVSGGVAVPVSGPLTDAQLRASVVPVGDGAGSLTMDSAQLPSALAAGGGIKVEGVAGGVAQPVSGTVTANAGTGPWPVTDNAGSLTVDGTFWQATQPVSGTFWQATQPVSGTVTVTPPTLTKGTQAATGFSVQDLKDAGRAQVCLAWEEMAGTANVESTLTNFTTGSRGGSALSAATNLTVTAAKTLRIQAVNIYVKATSTVNNLARFRIRQAASSIANSSPIIFDHVLAFEVTGTIAANAFHEATIPIPDGLEVAAGQQITFTWLTSANTCTVGMTVIGFEY